MNKHLTIALAATMALLIFASCQSKTETQLATLTLRTPTAGWSLNITDVYQKKNGQILCVARLNKPDGMAAQVISKVETSIDLPLSETPIKFFVLGKTWKWTANDHVTFIDSIEIIRTELEDAQPIAIAK